MRRDSNSWLPNIIQMFEGLGVYCSSIEPQTYFYTVNTFQYKSFEKGLSQIYSCVDIILSKISTIKYGILHTVLFYFCLIKKKIVIALS